MLAHARELGSTIRERLREAAAGTDREVEVRGVGLFIGAEFRHPDGTPDGDAVEAIQRYCFEHGVLVWKAGRHDNVLRLLPPLVLTESLAERALDVIADAIETATAAD